MVSLTFPPGPLATRPPTGTNYAVQGPPHRLLLQPHAPRVRAEVDGRVVLDTVRGALLHESNLLPVLYVPREDVDAALLQPSETTTHCPFKGDASYEHLRVGERLVADAVWAYPAPVDAAAWLEGLVSLRHDAADRWLEEDEEVLGHLRDPYHRVDALRSSRRVVVRVGETIVGETTRPVLVAETGFPLRAYVPREDVREELLVPSDTSAVCPYKGVSRYWSVAVDGTTVTDAAWSYERPLREAEAAAGHLCFLADGVDVELADA